MKKTKQPKRKSRDTHQATIDLVYPVDFDFTKLGGPEDPCFGKLFDPKDPICQRCGDSELCQIYLAQKNHVKRLEVEQKGKFRDIEEKKIYDSAQKEYTVKEIKAGIRGIIRDFKKIPVAQVINQASKKYGLSEKECKKHLTRMGEITSKFTIKNNVCIWNN